MRFNRFLRALAVGTALLGVGMATLVATFAVGSPAAAQDDQSVLTGLDFDGYYIAPDAVDEVTGFEELIDRANATGDNWYFVSLRDEPAGGPSVYAGFLADELPDSGTVIVINEYESDGQIRFEAGIASADYSNDSLNKGEDVAANTLAGGSGSALDVANALFDGIGAQKSSGGGVSAAWLLVPVGGAGALYVGSRIRDKRKDEERDVEDLETAKAEIKTQLDAVANYVISQADYVELSSNEEAKQHYAEATETFSEVESALARTDDLLELAKLNDRVDYARWQMEATEALIDGRDVPPKPTPDAPVACFFDPTHRPGTEEVMIKTAAGEKGVRVCRDDAEKLKRGEQPEPRMIDVHGRRVPAAKAPRSHGGLGMGGIDFFDIILGGMSAAGRGQATRRRSRVPTGGAGSGFPWDWSDGSPSRPQPRSRGGVFGPDSIPRSRNGSGRRRNTSRPKRRTTGKRATKGRSRRRF